MSNTTLCNLTADEALGMAQEFAEKAEERVNHSGPMADRYATLSLAYAQIAAVKQAQQTTT